IIRGGFEGALRAQAIHACLDTLDTVMEAAKRGALVQSGPKWPATVILGEAEQSSVGDPDGNGSRIKGKKLRR
ncbi:MAG: hypothetical protein ACM3ND_11605, partial [Acidobacteriota bacterium]